MMSADLGGACPAAVPGCTVAVNLAGRSSTVSVGPLLQTPPIVPDAAGRPARPRAAPAVAVELSDRDLLIVYATRIVEHEHLWRMPPRDRAGRMPAATEETVYEEQRPGLFRFRRWPLPLGGQ